MKPKQWYVYILQCSDGTLYTGATDDLDKRIRTHNMGQGAKYTRGRIPVTLRYCENCQDRSAALRREYQIKQLSRIEKMALFRADVAKESE